MQKLTLTEMAAISGGIRSCSSPDELGCWSCIVQTEMDQFHFEWCCDFSEVGGGVVCRWD